MNLQNHLLCGLDNYRTTIPLAFVFFFISLFSFSQELKFEEKAEGVLLLEGEKPRYFYRTLAGNENEKFSRTNYVHPLYGLNNEILTEDFPEDHPHHHGIFWAWHQLYANGERIADPWLNEGIKWKVIETGTEVQGQKARLNLEILWIQTSEDKAVIQEDLSISFERLGGDVFILLFEITLKALTDGVAIGGSEDAKGYGGFSARLVLPEDISFNSATGVVQPEVNPIQAGGWINISGQFDSNNSEKTGIVIMGEPSKLPSYKGWVLRSSESMQNMAFPGRNPISILKGETLHFRNQLVVHGGLTKDEVEKIYQNFVCTSLKK